MKDQALRKNIFYLSGKLRPGYFSTARIGFDYSDSCKQTCIKLKFVKPFLKWNTKENAIEIKCI